MIEYDFYINDFDRTTDPIAKEIFRYPNSFWFGTRHGKSKFHNLDKRVNRLLARAHPSLPVMVLYNLPDRDLGSHSKGGAKSTERYLEYVRIFSDAIGDRKPILIFEPDAIPHSTSMPKYDADRRLELMERALRIITANSNSLVYVDAGHSNWLSPDQAGALLDAVHTPGVRGFSVNVSNYRTTEESMRWALNVSEKVEAPHFVIDTSRNGNGPYGNDWCNPPGRALGIPPTTRTDSELCDAYLWIKVPGESDGKCNGGPPAGKFWVDYARELVNNSKSIPISGRC